VGQLRIRTRKLGGSRLAKLPHSALVVIEVDQGADSWWWGGQLQRLLALGPVVLSFGGQSSQPGPCQPLRFVGPGCP